MGKVQYLVFDIFFLVLAKFLFWEGVWALAYNFVQFLDFADSSKFPKIVCLYLFGKS